MATNTTELISFSPPYSLKGPVILSDPIAHHCAVLVEDKVYVLGGHKYLSEWEFNLKKAFSISIHDGSISHIPDMNAGHSYHGCAFFKNGNKTFIAVAGGQTCNYMERNVTEIFDIQENVWLQGKFFPDKSEHLH